MSDRTSFAGAAREISASVGSSAEARLSDLSPSDAEKWESILKRCATSRGTTIFLYQDGDYTRPRLLIRHRLNNRRLQQQVIKYKDIILESGLME